MYRIQHFALILSMAFAPVFGQTAAEGPERETFRVRSTSVPIDVTVLDGEAKPVLDLTAADFEVFENGTKQNLDHFFPPRGGRSETASDAATTPDFSRPAPPRPPDATRYFLILLGNIGRDEFNSLDDLAAFVRSLGPNDQVALMAFRRVGRLSNEHPKTAETIRLYGKVNKRINSLLEGVRRLPLFSRLSPPSERLPSTARAAIRRFFEESGLSSRELLEPTPEQLRSNPLNRALFERLRQLDSLDALASLQFQGPDSPGLQADPAAPPSFAVNEFDQARLELLSDLPPREAARSQDIGRLDASQILSAIEHLYHLSGDKHILFFNDRGLDVERTEELERIGKFAASGQIRLHLFQTGGTAPSPSVLSNITNSSHERTEGFNLKLGGKTASLTLALDALRTLARDTGGTVSVHSRVGGALERALDAADFAYRLAYTPADARWDGKFRSIRVSVKRDDVRLLYRRGYLGVPPPTQEERMESLIRERTLAAMRQPDRLREIPLLMGVSRLADLEDVPEFEVRLEAQIPDGVFSRLDGGWVGRLAVAYYLVDNREFVTVQDQVHLTLNDGDYQTALQKGFNFKRRLAVPKALAKGVLKVVVYQPDRDLVGSIAARLPL